MKINFSFKVIPISKSYLVHFGLHYVMSSCHKCHQINEDIERLARENKL